MSETVSSESKLEAPLKNGRKYWFAAAIMALAIAIWSGLDMRRLLEEETLWGYRPLTFYLWVYLCLSFLVNGIRNISKRKFHLYLLASVAAVLLSISFPPLPFLILIVPGWAIIMLLADRAEDLSLGYQYRMYFHVFILWNIITTYWIGNTAFAAGIAAMFTNTLLMASALTIYSLTRKNLPAKFHFLLFAACWIGFEYFHFRWEAHWPWLAIGHYFMDQPWMVQWYEWTGILGGSLWVLALAWQLKYLVKQKITWRSSIPICMLLVIPMVMSLIIGNNTIPGEDQIQVAIVQPNYEPHYVKGQIPQQVEVRHFIELAKQVVTEKTDYLVFPETSFAINLNKWDRSIPVNELNRFLETLPNLTLISGLETNYILESGEAHDEYTRTYINSYDTIYWENHNTAVRMSAGKEKEIYYKSKLVPGAEFFPFKNALFFLKPLMDKLGGSGSGLRKQEERSTFIGEDGHKVAPVICYESVYGEYVNGYFEKGAEWVAVMTNDGWWDVTAGHKQHLGLSVLRAIEQRKWIARSANSGISCFIDPHGQIIQPTNYGEEDAIVGQIETNQIRTVYSRMGDVIGRIFILLLCVMILFVLGKKVRSL